VRVKGRELKKYFPPPRSCARGGSRVKLYYTLCRLAVAGLSRRDGEFDEISIVC